MSDVKLYDISEVCDRFGVSSRTLRFYEEKKLISSLRGENGRREYTKEQVDSIRNVLTLRAIGLSVKNIQEYLNENVPLASIVELRKAEVQALVNGKLREIKMMNDALIAIESGKDIFLPRASENGATGENDALAYECAGYIAEIKPEKVYEHVSEKIQNYMPVESFRCVIKDTVRELGKFLRQGDLLHDFNNPNVIFCFLEYEKLNLRVKFVFNGNVIHGIWFNYFEKAK